jgi:hypothetical protein
MVINSTNINKTKQSPLNSDGHQLFRGDCFVLLILVELMTITVLEVIVCFVDIARIDDHH